MSKLSLIPFGLRLTDQQFVDVAEVEKGRECGCICPSCETPLIARQGEINEWHFAHASKNVESDIEDECKYSFWVSVILMAKQIIKKADSITLPLLNMYTNEAVKVNISEQKTVTLDKVEIDQKINSVEVDATLKIGRYIIAIIFTAPHRQLKDYNPVITKSNKIGLLEISLTDADQLLFTSNNQGKYGQVLKTHILSKNKCKRWVYHPRISIIEKKHGIDLYEKNLTLLDNHDEKPKVVEHKTYKCLECGGKWYGTHQCVACNTHLYSTEVGNA